MSIRCTQKTALVSEGWWVLGVLRAPTRARAPRAPQRAQIARDQQLDSAAFERTAKARAAEQNVQPRQLIEHEVLEGIRPHVEQRDHGRIVRQRVVWGRGGLVVVVRAPEPVEAPRVVHGARRRHPRRAVL